MPRLFTLRPVLGVLMTLLPGLSSAVAAQVVVLDEGSFSLYRSGERIGREDFSIRTAPGADGRVLVAQATVATGDRRLAPGINADTTGFPARYQREVRLGGAVIERYQGQATRGRFSSQLLLPEGESAREFRLPPGTVVADDDVVHQLWLITRRGAGAVVPVLVPRRNVVETVNVESAGKERLSIDLRQFETTKLVLRGGAGVPMREVWVGTDGRILKASLPALGIVALRD
jgi:hypothetical protein